MPQVNKQFSIMGSSFCMGAGALIDKLKPNQRLELLREPTNKHDKNAIQVLWGPGRQLGWVPRQLAETLAPLMDAGTEVICRKAPPLQRFGAFRGILELAYLTEDAPDGTRTSGSEPQAGTPAAS